MNPEQRKPDRRPGRRRRRWIVALLVSVLLHGLVLLWAMTTEKPSPPDTSPHSQVAQQKDDRPVAVSLFDPTQGRPDGDSEARTQGDAPVSDDAPTQERARRRRPAAPPPVTSPEPVTPPTTAPSSGGDESDEPADEPPAPDPGADTSSPDSSPDLSPDADALARSGGLPVPGPAETPERSQRTDRPRRADRSGGRGTGGPGDPGSARLFDPDVIGKSVSRWRAAQPSREELMDRYGADDEDSPGAEQERVAARLGRDIDSANTMGEVRGGLLSGCNDGLDNNYDGWIDCGDPSCRAVLPFCQGTIVLSNVDRREIPDDDTVGASSEVVVGTPGTIRALSVKLRVKHTSPGDLAVVLEHLDTKRTVVLRKTNRSERQYVSAFYTKDFNGGPVAGRWRITVRDLVAGGTGWLEEWHLVITG